MSLNILQIDDDIVNNMAIMRLAKKSGMTANFINFTDPTDAITYFKTEEIHNVDLIILDVNMPKLSGWEVLDEIEKLNVNIPIVMVTSSLDPEERNKANSNPLLKGFFIKPITSAIFAEILTCFA